MISHQTVSHPRIPLILRIAYPKPLRAAMYANYDMTFRFLRAMRPRGPWTLSSINPNGGPRIPTRTFLIGPLDLVEDVQTAVCAWLQEWNTDQTADVYFSANPTRTVMRKRPKEKDIGYCQFIAADFDPLGGEAADECQE